MSIESVMNNFDARINRRLDENNKALIKILKQDMKKNGKELKVELADLARNYKVFNKVNGLYIVEGIVGDINLDIDAYGAYSLMDPRGSREEIICHNHYSGIGGSNKLEGLLVKRILTSGNLVQVKGEIRYNKNRDLFYLRLNEFCKDVKLVKR